MLVVKYICSTDVLFYLNAKESVKKVVIERIGGFHLGKRFNFGMLSMLRV